MTKERIQYIDAMRGFTMILVIYSHVCVFCFQEYFMAFNDILFLLRLPCFFMISGWLFYKIGRVWDASTVRQVVHNKFMVQIVPTFIFLALHERTNFFHQLGAFKGGYWFTFALFIFFVLYIFITKLTTYLFPNSPHLREGMGVGFAFIISMSAYWYDINYSRIVDRLGWSRELLGFLGFVTWRYYIFFFLGTFVKKYFDRFLRLTDRLEVIIGIPVVFFLLAFSPRNDCFLWMWIRFLVSGTCGMVMVFTFFRKLAHYFTKERLLGKGLQYVGTRTLDVYLLHFFFLPESLLSYNRQLLCYGSKGLESAVAIGEAFVVLMACLVASYILRLSPFLAQLLFGERRVS